MKKKHAHQARARSRVHPAGKRRGAKNHYQWQRVALALLLASSLSGFVTLVAVSLANPSPQSSTATAQNGNGAGNVNAQGNVGGGNANAQGNASGGNTNAQGNAVGAGTAAGDTASGAAQGNAKKDDTPSKQETPKSDQATKSDEKKTEQGATNDAGSKTDPKEGSMQGTAKETPKGGTSTGSGGDDRCFAVHEGGQQEVSCKDPLCTVGHCLVPKNDFGLPLLQNRGESAGTIESSRGDEGAAVQEERNREEQEREERKLGCFRPDGQWTSNRSECARAPEKRGMMGPSTESQEERAAFQEYMREKFDARSAGAADKNAELLALIAESIERIADIDTERLSESTHQLIDAAVGRLQAIHDEHVALPKTPEEIRLAGHEVRQTLIELEQAIQQDVKARGEAASWAKMEAIITKVSRIIERMPQALAVLEREQIALDGETLALWEEIQADWTEVRATCTARERGSCDPIGSVIAGLVKIREPIREAALSTGNEAIYEEIKAVFDAE